MFKYNKFNFCITIAVLFYFSLLIGFFFDENSSGGSRLDFFTTWPLITEISKDFVLGIKFIIDSSLIHFPMHYVLSAVFFKLLNNVELLRFIFLNISVLIPLYFYKCLKVKFKNTNAIIILSTLIFISPYFRSSAIWITTDNTAILFFTISIFFFLRIIKENNDEIINYILFILFITLSALTRQYYITFLVYFLFILYKKDKIQNQLKKKIIYLILFISPFAYLLLSKILTNNVMQTALTKNIFNNIYINLSIIFFYLSPFIVLYKKNLKDFYIFFIYKKYTYTFLFLVLGLFFYKFNYQYNIGGGGGFYFQLSNLYKAKVIFFIASFLGLSILYYLTSNNFNNLILIFILFLIFNYNTVYQKYFDPLLIIVYFTLFTHKSIAHILEKNWTSILGVFLYFFLFWITSLIIHL
jgi:hypothetical protein